MKNNAKMNMPDVYSDSITLRKRLDIVKRNGETIGFVPTMGALHEGHLSLIEKCLNDGHFCVISIFVNPRQFNDPSDFSNYPRHINEDLHKLSRFSKILVYVPNFETIYPNNLSVPHFDLNGLDEKLEGISRPGHFQGVVQVVSIFFALIKPDFAFFGEKDFQQVCIIKSMVKNLNLPIDIITCATLREKNGLAMSSRNLLLSVSQREEAEVIFKVLSYIKTNIQGQSIETLLKFGTSIISKSSFRLDYLAIVEAKTLNPIDNFQGSGQCCIAVFCDKVRLIDNIEL